MWDDLQEDSSQLSIIFSDFPYGFPRQLANDYHVPRPLHRFSTEDIFTIGNMHAGALPATKHGVGWLAVAQGGKHWFLQDPNYEWAGYQPDCDYERDSKDKTTVQCVQLPGEIIFLPEAWWHATCNIGKWTVCIGAQSSVAGMNDTASDLIDAAWRGDLSTLNALHSQSIVNVTQRSSGVWPLQFAARRGHLEFVKRLVELGADVDAVDAPQPGSELNMDNWWENGGFRAMHLAARFGHVEIVDYLIKHNATIDAADWRGRTPLHWAATKHQLAVLKASSMSPCKCSMLPVCRVSSSEMVLRRHSVFAAGVILSGCCQVLVAAGAKVDQPDSTDQTPLVGAIASVGWVSVIEFLVAHGASVTGNGGASRGPLGISLGCESSDYFGSNQFAQKVLQVSRMLFRAVHCTLTQLGALTVCRCS